MVNTGLCGKLTPCDLHLLLRGGNCKLYTDFIIADNCILITV